MQPRCMHACLRIAGWFVVQKGACRMLAVCQHAVSHKRQRTEMCGRFLLMPCALSDQ